MANIVGIDVEIIKENQLNSGCGQYLIKNTNYELFYSLFKKLR